MGGRRAGASAEHKLELLLTLQQELRASGNLNLSRIPRLIASKLCEVCAIEWQDPATGPQMEESWQGTRRAGQSTERPDAVRALLARALPGLSSFTLSQGRKKQSWACFLAPLAPGARGGGKLLFAIPGGEASLRKLRREMRLFQAIAALVECALERRLLEARTQRAERVKDEFLGALSYQLRTPLNVILGWTELLKAGKTELDILRKGLETITRNAYAQAKLVDDLLDFSDVMSGKLTIRPEPVDFTEAVQGAIESLKLAAHAKGIRLVTEFSKPTEFVSGDAVRLKQIAWHLLSNAVKFSARNAVVTVHLRPEKQTVVLTVTDSGQGIEAGFIPRLFDPWAQLDGTNNPRHPGGLGVGLALTKRLVDLHGGSLEAMSEGRGQGARFTLRLPQMATPRFTATLNSKTAEAIRLADPTLLAGLTVLLVDDSEDICTLGKLVLSRAGAKVITAQSARDALEKFRRKKPDVFISDIGMPEEDGYSLIEKVRRLESEQLNPTPAAALTAMTSEDDARRIFEAGYQTHLPKPVEPFQLVSAVAGLTGRAAKA